MELAGHLAFDQGLSDLTGFEQDGREFAVVGLIDSIAVAFIDITDPANPVEMGRISGTPSTWRDLKYWNRHVYIGTEAQDGVKVISLDIPDNPVLVYTITDFGGSHNIHIDSDGYLYVIGAADHDVWIYELTDHPETPVLIGTWDGEYFHDIEVYNNNLYGAAIYSGYFYIIDVSDKTNPTTILSHYTGGVNTHDCAVTDDEHYLITADETAGGHIKIWDISNYNNINLVSEYMTPPEHSMHNVYVRPGTNLLIMSYYVDGTRILDITDPVNPVEVGYFDTSELTGLYDGNWGTYAYLPSGYIISSDRQNGLFIFSSPLTDSLLSWSDCDPNKNNWYGDYNDIEISIINELIELNPALNSFQYDELVEFKYGRIITIYLGGLGLDSLIFPYDIGNLTNLESLNLADNNLTNLPNTICALPENCTIDVSGNHLCLGNPLQLYDDCISISGYQYCDDCASGYLLDGYCINSADLSVLESIISVNSSLNGIHPLELGNPSVFSYWLDGDLALMDLSLSNITTIPDNIGDLDNIIELNINGNFISELPENIGGMQKLEILRIYNNLLNSLPGNIGNLENLKELFLSGNQLTSIPESIGDLGNLQKLYLQENLISTLPSTFCDLPEECTIKLDDNCLNESNITGSFECISDLGDQNECINMNLDIYQPSDLQLFVPFPNPFNPLTKIEYNLPYVGDVSLIIYDIMGRQVEILYDGIQYQGNYTISWDASNYSSGVYFIKMNVRDSQSPISQSQKLVLLK